MEAVTPLSAIRYPLSANSSDRGAMAGSGQEMARRILRNSTFNLAAQVLSSLFQVMVVFILARGIGKEGFGEYFTLFSVILVVQMLLEQGASTVLTCRVAQAPVNWKDTVAEAAGLFAIITLASALVVVGLGAAWTWFRPESSVLWGAAAAGVACAAMQVERFCGGVFHAFEVFAYENACKILQGASFVALVLVLLGLGRVSVGGVLTMLAISHMLSALFLLVILQRCWHCLAFRLNRGTMKSWLSQAIPLGVGDVARGLASQLGTLLLGLFQPAAAVGIYSLAYRPLGPIGWLPRCVLQAAFPSIARLAADNRAALDGAFAVSTRLLWVSSLPIAVPICLYAGPLVALLAGPDFGEATLPMQLLIWITALSFLSYPFRYLLTALGRSRTYVRLALLQLLVVAGTQVLLLPSLSYYGACAGSLLGEFVFMVVGLILCCRLGVRALPWRPFAGAALAAAALAAALWPVRGWTLPLFAAAAVPAAVLYIVLCVLFGALRRQEVGHLIAVIRRLLRPGAGSAQSPPHLGESAALVSGGS
jgi:O-antigen/teichoic acid export membrane protein